MKQGLITLVVVCICLCLEIKANPFGNRNLHYRHYPQNQHFQPHRFADVRNAPSYVPRVVDNGYSSRRATNIPKSTDISAMEVSESMGNKNKMGGIFSTATNVLNAVGSHRWGTFSERLNYAKEARRARIARYVRRGDMLKRYSPELFSESSSSIVSQPSTSTDGASTDNMNPFGDIMDISNVRARKLPSSFHRHSLPTRNRELDSDPFYGGRYGGSYANPLKAFASNAIGASLPFRSSLPFADPAASRAGLRPMTNNLEDYTRLQFQTPPDIPMFTPPPVLSSAAATTQTIPTPATHTPLSSSTETSTQTSSDSPKQE